MNVQKNSDIKNIGVFSYSDTIYFLIVKIVFLGCAANNLWIYRP